MSLTMQSEVLLVAQESNGACTGCVFFKADKKCGAAEIPAFGCSPRERTDRKHVIWVISEKRDVEPQA